MKDHTEVSYGTSTGISVRFSRTIAAFTALLAVITAFFCIRASAAAVNGISVSDSELERGDRFTVTVTVPAAAENADSASLRIEYDDSVFEPVIKVNWPAAGVTNASAGSGVGFIALSAGNSSRAIDMSSGITVSADFTVKENAPAGRYSFAITKGSFSYVEEDGVTVHELWEPGEIYAYVNVAGGQSSDGDDAGGGSDSTGDTGSTGETNDPDDGSETAIIPVTGGGIRLSKNRLTPGEAFYLYIDIPAADLSADTLSMRVDLDPDVFEVISWAPPLHASTAVNTVTGHLTVAASSATPTISLTNGLTLSAEIRAKSDAAGKTGSFSLTSYSLSRVEADGITNTELWVPRTFTASAQVTGGSTQTVPVTGGGISSSSATVRRGETFSVYITVPSVPENADTASILAEFDPDIFEVVSWSPVLPGSFANSGNGYFALSASNAGRSIILSGGITLKADLRVKNNTSSSAGTITLKKASLAHVKDNGYDYQELWIPSVTSVRINISQDGGSGTSGTRPYYTLPPYTTAQPAATRNTTASSTSRTAVVTLAPVIITTSRDDTTVPPDNDTRNNSDESFYDPDIPYDDEDDYDIPFDDGNSSGLPEDDPYNPDEDGGGNASAGTRVKRKINISLEQDLYGLGGEKIRIKTKYEFFEHDTVIIIDDLPANDPDALLMLEILGLKGHNIYPFDISVFDTVTNSYISRLPDGAYIEIAIPLPENMTAHSSALELYHIVNSYPEKITSSVTEENGVKKLVFRANSFSPYVIVDTTYTADPEIIMPPDIYISETRTDGAVNPATGAAAAVGIPAVLTCCVFLVRKRKPKVHRKRAKNNEPEKGSDQAAEDDI